MRNNGKPLTNDECTSIREMLHNGESHNSIAKKVGRAQSTISAFAQREGINPVNRFFRESGEMSLSSRREAIFSTNPQLAA